MEVNDNLSYIWNCWHDTGAVKNRMFVLLVIVRCDTLPKFGNIGIELGEINSMDNIDSINRLIQEITEKTSLTGEHFHCDFFSAKDYQSRLSIDTKTPCSRPDCDKTDYVVGEHSVTIWYYSSDFREAGLSTKTVTNLDELVLSIFSAEIWHIKVLAPLHDSIKTKTFSLSKQLEQGEHIEKRLRYRLLKTLFFSRRFWQLKKQMGMGLKHIKVGQIIQSFFTILAIVVLFILLIGKQFFTNVNLFYPATAVCYVFLLTSIIRLGELYDNKQKNEKNSLLLSQKLGIVLAFTFPISIIALKGFGLKSLWDVMVWGNFALVISAGILFYQKK